MAIIRVNTKGSRYKETMGALLSYFGSMVLLTEKSGVQYYRVTADGHSELDFVEAMIAWPPVKSLAPDFSIEYNGEPSVVSIMKSKVKDDITFTIPSYSEASASVSSGLSTILDEFIVKYESFASHGDLDESEARSDFHKMLEQLSCGIPKKCY